ncbi:MAG: hypothetical protein WCT50_00740 [Patescibacteria group bacterium]
MKKIKALMVMATSLFIIGMVGLIYFFCFVQNPLDTYFAFIVILAIATLPRTFLEFFMFPKNIDKNTFVGFIRFFIFFMNFSIMSDLIFPSTIRYSVIVHAIIVLVFFFSGMSYYRKHPADEETLESKN